MATAVYPNSQTFLGHNQETYQNLRLALQLNLRRQLLIAVCDDVTLQNQLAAQLEEHFSPYPETVPIEATVRSRLSPLVTLALDAEHPDLVREVLVWLKQQRFLQGSRPAVPVFQIVGIDQLTRQSPTLQNRFLASLIRVDALLTQLDCRLLVWVPRPWLAKIRQSVPAFWRSRSGLFEFAGEPLSSSQAPAQSSPPSSPNLWTMLQEDLSAFEPEATHPEASPPQPASPAPPPTDPAPQPPPDPPATTPSPQTTFAVIDHDTFSAVVMPPPGTIPAAVLEELHQTTPLPPSPTSPTSSTSPTSLTSPPLPPELADSEEVHRLWQYIQSLISQQAGPLTISRAYLALGQLSRDRLETAPITLDLLDFAIAAYNQASHGLLEGENDWCDALNDLASLYWLRAQQSSGDTATWLRRSVETYQRAIAAGPTTVSPDTLGRLYSNLGTVCGLLADHYDDPLPWLQQALEAYEQGLTYYPLERSPQDYGNLQNSLGALHWRLAQHQQPQHHLAQAIAAYQQALPPRSPQADPQADPQDYAMIQNNLGIAYWSLAQHQQPVVLLEQAIAAYTAALTYRTLEATPAGCAATHNNLGTAWWDLAQHQSDRLDALHQAATAYENALKAADHALRAPDPQPLGFDLWATFHSAGVVHDQIAQALPVDQLSQRESHLQTALRYYLLAYEGWRDHPEHLEVLVTALVYTVHLNFEILGIAGQQAALSQVPGELLPQILRQL